MDKRHDIIKTKNASRLPSHKPLVTFACEQSQWGQNENYPINLLLGTNISSDLAVLITQKDEAKVRLTLSGVYSDRPNVCIMMLFFKA